LASGRRGITVSATRHHLLEKPAVKNAFLTIGLALLATPLLAQSEIGRSPVLDQGSVTCAEYLRMGLPERFGALEGIEPMDGEMAESSPDLVRQWSEEVAAACDGHPDRTLFEAATEALGAN
jgi:hypothetical protein